MNANTILGRIVEAAEGSTAEAAIHARQAQREIERTNRLAKLRRRHTNQMHVIQRLKEKMEFDLSLVCPLCSNPKDSVKEVCLSCEPSYRGLSREARKAIGVDTAWKGADDLVRRASGQTKNQIIAAKQEMEETFRLIKELEV